MFAAAIFDAAEVLFCKHCWAEATVPIAKEYPKLRHADAVWCGYSFSHDSVIRAAVHALKYDGQKRLANIMAKKLIPRMTTRCVEVDLMWVPVPQHWRRRMLRGFNQSESLATALAIETSHHKPVNLLSRVKHTPTQTALSYTERSNNIKDAFTVRKCDSLPASVLVIDDVITTGATMDECARTLKARGVKWVGALSFALAER